MASCELNSEAENRADCLPGAEYCPPRSSLDDRTWDSDFRTLELIPLDLSLESQAFGFSLTIIISFLGSEIFGVTLSQTARTQGTPAHRRPARGLPSLCDVSQFQYVWIRVATALCSHGCDVLPHHRSGIDGTKTVNRNL
ncbi:hypothetical protein U0070_001836 [Myodes glareolus]|uniref:Uncharacterized protein n=1 Tax=Myodes glareolus TaxID=447135 RepID=A0AAW0IS71_MYOGA